MDQAGNAYVTGITDTPGSGFPGTAGSLIQRTFGGDSMRLWRRSVLMYRSPPSSQLEMTLGPLPANEDKLDDGHFHLGH